MVRQDGSFVKIQRHVEISKQIAKHLPAPVSYEKTLLWIRVNIGLSPTKAIEYLQDVLDSHGWVVEDGVIKPEPAE